MSGGAMRFSSSIAYRVAVVEKPDILWDRPQLDRLYTHLESEYELKERADALTRKLTVIGADRLIRAAACGSTGILTSEM